MFVVVWAVGGLGRPGACPCGKMGGWSCLVGLLLAGVVGLSVLV